MDERSKPECSYNCTAENSKKSNHKINLIATTSVPVVAKSSFTSLPINQEENSVETPLSFSIASTTLTPAKVLDEEESLRLNHATSIPHLNAHSKVVATEPRILSSLPSPVSVIVGQPQNLFVQALSKLNENNVTETLLNLDLNTYNNWRRKNLPVNQVVQSSPELSTPDSLASAPPSYSYVLRQMAFRRRPRVVGTFLPSPSFVQPTPPPNYAASFDIYLNNLPVPPRAYNFGFTPMLVACPNCGYTGLTIVTSKITLCTHLCAIALCILCCWICAPLPYLLRSCKNVSHYCRNCRTFLGMYCHANPNNVIP